MTTVELMRAYFRAPFKSTTESELSRQVDKVIAEAHKSSLPSRQPPVELIARFRSTSVPVDRREYLREWRRRNKDRIKELKTAWEKRNVDKVLETRRLCERRRRAKKKQVDINQSLSEVKVNGQRN